ncbi:MAG: methyltransferase type 11 [Planctomycetes bacterium]|jgi:SAM-dependent methyltransferase|nr:methyltransferase type 11 [Planctomycetota bacterium]
MPADHVVKNRSVWNADSDTYQKRHAGQLDASPLAWGIWSVEEAQLGALGDFEGKCMLELGCGAAQWSTALAVAGGHVVGFDLSERQLTHAIPRVEATGLWVPLVQGSAEELPFVAESFDIVFSDHGATSFSDPYRTIPEAARVLRPGGLLVFNITSPLRDLCEEDELGRPTEKLSREYFELGRLSGKEVCFQLPYGRWLALFRDAGFEVLDLIELRPPEGAVTTYKEFSTLDWSRRWPSENLWRLRKRPAS